MSEREEAHRLLDELLGEIRNLKSQNAPPTVGGLGDQDRRNRVFAKAAELMRHVGVTNLRRESIADTVLGLRGDLDTPLTPERTAAAISDAIAPDQLGTEEGTRTARFALMRASLDDGAIMGGKFALEVAAALQRSLQGADTWLTAPIKAPGTEKNGPPKRELAKCIWAAVAYAIGYETDPLTGVQERGAQKRWIDFFLNRYAASLKAMKGRPMTAGALDRHLYGTPEVADMFSHHLRVGRADRAAGRDPDPRYGFDHEPALERALRLRAASRDKVQPPR